MNNAVLGEIMQNVIKHIDIKLVKTEARRNYLVSKQSLAIEIRKTQILMNKCVYLGLSKLELSRKAMYEFCYD